MDVNAGKPYLFYSGESMSGVFRPGDELLCRSLPYNELRIGDVIVFSAESGKLIVHRVIRFSDSGDPVTMGDNNPTPDRKGPGKLPEYRLVTGFRRRDLLCSVRNGRAGMTQFYRNRLRRTILHNGRFLEYMVPRRLRIRSLKQTVFGKSVHFSWLGIRIAVDDGKMLRFRHPALKLFFAPERRKG